MGRPDQFSTQPAGLPMTGLGEGHQAIGQPPGWPAGRPPGTRSWWSRHWKWVVPVSVVAPILVCGGFMTLVVTMAFGMIKSSGPYEEAVAAARGDTAVVAALGLPIEEGFFVMGSIEVSPSSGYAELAIPISGPKGGGTIFVVAEKYSGTWTYDQMEVSVDATGEWIDLLDR